MDDKKTTAGPLKVVEPLINVPPFKKNQWKQHFIAGYGEIVVHLSNFGNTKKFFKVNVEEVDEDGNAIAPPAVSEQSSESNVATTTISDAGEKGTGTEGASATGTASEVKTNKPSGKRGAAKEKDLNEINSGDASQGQQPE